MCNIPIGHTLVCPVTVAERCISAMFLSFKGFKEVFKFGHIQTGGNTAEKPTYFSPLMTLELFLLCMCLTTGPK